MRCKDGILLGAVFALAACGSSGGGNGGGAVDDGTPEAVAVALEPVFEGLSFTFPVALVQAPGDDTRWFVAERAGRVWMFANRPDVADAEMFLDISDRVSAAGEGGLLGMAFHPRFAANGEVFISYTAPGAPLVSHVARFRLAGASLDPASEEALLTLEQPFDNHNGGHILFGPDGFLYIGFGDGGSAGDPLGNGQDTSNLFGALLRIDVDGGPPYAVPPDNPLVGGAGRPEIWAWGLRNPWRFSFDRATGDLWLGDVGQAQWEEVNRIQRGGNYGWNIREGAHCFAAPTCAAAGLIDPVAEYGHDLGCSITGGYVYRGGAIPSLHGAYLYGDFCSGRVWALDPATAVVRELLDTDLNIVSFAEDQAGELYLVDGGGRLRRLVPAPAP